MANGPSAHADMRVMHITVQGQTAAKLREGILAGLFKPGERLIEANLCTLLGVSRTSVREALRTLETEKLVTITPNKGPAVTEITWEEARKIYEVRAILEKEAAALMARQATDDEIARMRQALVEFDQAVTSTDSVGLVTATGRFYDVILKGCGNSIIAEMLQGLNARINYLRSRSMSLSGRSRLSAIEMWRILEAIEKRDADAAGQAAVDHVHAACKAAKNVFDHVEPAQPTALAPRPRRGRPPKAAAR